MIATAPTRGTVRNLLVGFVAFALAGCAGIVPKSEPAPLPPPEAGSPTGPSANVLPDADEQRHRVALLVPLSGQNAAVGQSLANATTMALLDTNTSNIRITSYDTAAGPEEAARRAVADGNALILGPLLGDNVASVEVVTDRANVPVISFSNNTQVADENVFVIGQVPAQSIARTMSYAAGKGVKSFAALVPAGEYGKRATDAIMQAGRDTDTRVVAIETYDRTSATMNAAINRLAARGDFDALMIADSARQAVRVAPLVREKIRSPRLLGTELWSGEAEIAQSSALRGAWFSAISDGRFKRFSDSYRDRFGSAPYRISTLGYDAVLLAINISRDWKPGTRFPANRLDDDGGFLGLDGAFRFDDGVIERMFEVREVTASGVQVVDPAPAKF